MKCFDYGQKNHWRRWVWNRILERPRPRGGVYLYLAGPEALDVKVATRKGVKLDDMIAIEKDAAVLKTLRARGLWTVSGDLWDVLDAWPPTVPVAAVFADFCGGLSSRAPITVQNILGNKAFINSVFCFNLLRGRDQQSNRIREIIAKAMIHDERLGFLSKALAASCKYSAVDFRRPFRSDYQSARPELNRARMIAYLFLGVFMDSIETAGVFNSFKHINPDGLATRVWAYMDPTFSNYASASDEHHRNYYDSVVLSSPAGLARGLNCQGIIEPKTGDPQRRKIAAILAHRTRRI